MRRMSGSARRTYCTRSMPRPLHIVFAGGVTPSHLYPGLAVAAHVVERMPDAVITFVGSSRSLERHAVRAAGFAFANLPSQPAPQKRAACRAVCHAQRGGLLGLALVSQGTTCVAGRGSGWLRECRNSSGRHFPRHSHGHAGAECRSRPRHALAGSLGQCCLRWISAKRRAYFPSAVPVIVTGNPARPAFERLYRQRTTRQVPLQRMQTEDR